MVSDKRTRWFFLMMACGWLGWGQAGLCGVGSSDSVNAHLDNRRPDLVIDDEALASWYYPGDVIPFPWSITDLNPGSQPDDYRAWILAPSGPRDEISYFPDVTGYTWHWTVPGADIGTHRLVVFARDAFGNAVTDTAASFIVLDPSTDVPQRPTSLVFAEPAPNPFNPRVGLSFILPRDATVALSVYDARGRHIRDLVRGKFATGRHEVVWDGSTGATSRAPAGVYFFVLDVAGSGYHERATRKAVLLP